MRNSLKLLAPISLIALAACSYESNEDAAGEAEYGSAAVEEAEVAADAAGEAVAPIASPSQGDAGRAVASDYVPLADGPEIPVSLPKMAYLMNYGFRLAGDAIAPLQQQHADMSTGRQSSSRQASMRLQPMSSVASAVCAKAGAAAPSAIARARLDAVASQRLPRDLRASPSCRMSGFPR